MKHFILLSSAVILFAACNNSESNKTDTTEKQEVLNSEGKQYLIDSSSTVSWTGSKPTGSHTGTFRIKDGSVTVNDANVISAGNFNIDVTSLADVDLAADPESKGKLEGHLKSPDFFNITKYPTASFAITSVEPYMADSSTASGNFTHLIKGNLTLKDSTKNVSFPAKITVDANSLAASADFNIDRTTWGMNYKGPNNPQDWFISKTVNIKLNIKASKK